MMNCRLLSFRRAGLWLFASLTLWVAGCTTPPPPKPPPPPPPQPAPAPKPVIPLAKANDPFAYRLEMARYLYERYQDQVHSGRLAPLLKGVGVIEVTINDQGRVVKREWIRAPHHVPEVVSAIEQMIDSAQPYPAPRFATQTTYLQTWLWDRSGKFQLDSLSLGQD